MLMKARVVCRSGARAATLAGARGYKNFVFSDTLRQLERDCNRVCEVPVPRIQKVTVLGAASPVGAIASFMLKQQPLVHHLAMYDESTCVLGCATDIAHVDTSASVEAYQGQPYLCPALQGADVVLLCGGEGCAGAGAPERDAFAANARSVRGYVTAVAQFAPEAVLAIQTPPVDANFSLAMHTLMQLHKFDRRRLVGVNAPSAMRASQLAGTPGARTPVLCGGGRCTRLPVFGNQTQKFSSTRSDVRRGARVPSSWLVVQSAECLTRLVRGADELVAQLKGGCGEAHLSVGFACARFVVELMQGMFVAPRTGDSGLVLAAGAGGAGGAGGARGEEELRVRSGPLLLGAHGVEGCAQPPLNDLQKRLLEESKCEMADSLRMGRCYATNEFYFTHPCKQYDALMKKRTR